MVGRRPKKGMRRWIEELRSLLVEYDHLLMVSDVLGVPVSEEGEMLRNIVDQHPEYEGFLPGEEIEVEDETTVNPRLHIAVEAAVQTQIAKDDPPEAREAYLTLLGAGMDGHEARHAINLRGLLIPFRLHPFPAPLLVLEYLPEDPLPAGQVLQSLLASSLGPRCISAAHSLDTPPILVSRPTSR